jgi:release factor glutamine methyltransferase
MMTLRELRLSVVQSLSPVYGDQEARALARLLLYAIEPDELSDQQCLLVQDRVGQLLRGIPAQYVLGHTIFYGHTFDTDPRALIPRPETEELVRTALELYPDNRKTMAVLDIGTGTGCIPITLKIQRPHWQITSVDISAEALSLAAENATRHKTDIHCLQLDFLDATDRARLGQYDLIISNPPYIPEREKKLMSSAVLDYEPSLALFVKDEDPLIFYRTIADFAQTHTRAEAGILLEMNEFLAEETAQLFAAYCGEKPEIIRDMQQKPRILWAKKRKIPQ